ncbi:hypothetical protein O6P43_023762 [Quillaja saponaria]|uniref:Uncharacterized protein n=1 Tax=Quillaja saponaria TaxID=32244 RepID=A0AAD7LFY1_QUISA|nr:hypothetical protein O6P43_023762 [Quillaja saponaria]
MIGLSQDLEGVQFVDNSSSEEHEIFDICPTKDQDCQDSNQEPQVGGTGSKVCQDIVQDVQDTLQKSEVSGAIKYDSKVLQEGSGYLEEDSSLQPSRGELDELNLERFGTHGHFRWIPQWNKGLPSSMEDFGLSAMAVDVHSILHWLSSSKAQELLSFLVAILPPKQLTIVEQSNPTFDDYQPV